MDKLRVLHQVLFSMASDMADNSFVFWNSHEGVLHLSHSCDGPDGPGVSLATINQEGLAKLLFATAYHIGRAPEILNNEYLDEYAGDEYISEDGPAYLKLALKSSDSNKEAFDDWMTYKV